MPDFVLALDQGTTSSRAILFDRAGRPRAVEQREFPQLYPRPGWVEHDPEEIWESQIEVARRVLASGGAAASDVAAIGIANQRETVVAWERRTGRPVANAIVWQDRRSADICESLRAAGHEALFRAKTGLPLDPYFSGTKIRWLLDNVPGLRPRAENGEIVFGTVDSFMLSRLSGGAIEATDASNASRTLLHNIHTGEWDDELLALLDVPRQALTSVRATSHIHGETSLFGVPIPLAAVAGDQQAAAFGQACSRPGMVKNTYGTGSFLLMNTGDAVRASGHGLLTTVGWNLDGRTTYALEGSIFVTGAAVQWLRDELGIISTAAEIERLAASVADSGGVYMVPAFAGLGAPHWDPHARGAIVGLTRGVGRAHIARAALEAACYQTADVLEAMRADSGLEIEEMRVDGGMTVNNLLLQLQADIAGAHVVRPAVTETTALGAAYLAGLAVGFWRDAADIESNWSIDRTFEPRLSPDQRESMLHSWRRAIARARDWAQ